MKIKNIGDRYVTISVGLFCTIVVSGFNISINNIEDT